jgi:hypothetical protein
MYGLNCFNQNGATILDMELAHTPLIASGSVVAIGWNLTDFSGQLVNCGTSSPNTLLFVRTRNSENYLSIGQINDSSFRFKAPAGAIVDWRMYAANGTSDWSEDNTHGLTVRSQSNNILYTTNKYPPYIKAINDIIVDDSTYTGNDNSFIKTVNYGITAYDGNIPFISAHSLTYRYVVYGGSTQVGYCLASKWSDTTTCSFYWKRYYSTGFSGIYQSAPVGQRPVSAFIIR